MIIEFFCGTGGVGKTTLSASRALYLAKNQHVLLMTIDPSLRLKDLLNIKESGKLEKRLIDHGSLSCLLLDTEVSMQRVLSSANAQLKDYRILSLLAKPFGGLNEILAIVELGHLLEGNNFDTVIIDTPPGSHFLEFLDGLERVNNFFDESFVQVLNLFNDKAQTTSLFKTGTWFKGLLQTGIDKLLSYLGNVTGQSFVHEFVETIKTIYRVKDKFIFASKTLDEHSKNGNIRFYLVTHAEHNKSKELQNLRQCLMIFEKSSFIAILNYCALEEWEHDLKLLPTGEWKSYTDHLKNKMILQKSSLKNFHHILLFPHVFQPTKIAEGNLTIDTLITHWGKQNVN